MARHITHIKPPGASRGFTFVELFIAVLIAAILLSIATPNFTATIRKNRSESLLRELSGALSLARTEAASRGRTVTFCRSIDGASCGWGANFRTAGWIIFEDLNADGTVSANDTILRAHETLNNTLLYVTSNGVNEFLSVSFDRQGFSNQQITFVACDSSGDPVYARALEMANTGRTTMGRTNPAGDYLYIVGGGTVSCPGA